MISSKSVYYIRYFPITNTLEKQAVSVSCPDRMWSTKPSPHRARSLCPPEIWDADRRPFPIDNPGNHGDSPSRLWDGLGFTVFFWFFLWSQSPRSHHQTRSVHKFVHHGCIINTTSVVCAWTLVRTHSSCCWAAASVFTQMHLFVSVQCLLWWQGLFWASLSCSGKKKHFSVHIVCCVLYVWLLYCL